MKFAVLGRQSRVIVATILVLLAAGLAGCGHTPRLPQVKWPFRHAAASAPQPVEELLVETATGAAAAFPQFWDRNTLVIDLRSVSGAGSATLKRRGGASWPLRLALRVAPGSVGQLEVRGEARVVFPIAASGAAPVDLNLGPGVYSAATPAISLSWAPLEAAAP